ncbi:MAG: c-type cytochrome biogenesis protein CcmI [Gammaproteobacteria bacterium]|nr:c-type cytochrome biogenesis protein CcmI [Gammaproteobacteria bacterium]
MAMFWFWAALFVVLALVFVLPPLLRKGKGEDEVPVGVDQRALTLEVYRDQFTELENDLKIGTISQDQYEKAKQDIEKNMLADVGMLEKNAQHQAKASAKLANIAAGVIALAVPVVGVSLYMSWGAGEAGLDPSSATPQVAAAEHNEVNIEALVEQLHERLKAQPDDGEGWYMLARTYQYMRRFDEAVEAFKRAVELGGSNSPDVLATYADAIAMASDRTLTPESVALLKQALQLDPFHGQSLWLMGTASYQNSDFKGALEYWTRLLNVLQPGSQDHTQILANINEVRSNLGMAPMAAPMVGGPMMGAGPAMAQQGSAAPAANAGPGAVIKGKVSLSSKLAGKVSPEDTVFVFARAVDGPRMPLAIVRAQVKDLPMSFELSDAMAMNPNMTLSSVDKVIVGARVSKTGNAMPQPGDKQGLSGEITVGDKASITLVIDSEI